MTYDSAWRARAVSAAEVIAHVQSGQRVFVHGAAATPTPLLDALAERRELADVRLYHLHLAGPCRFAERDAPPGIVSHSLFTGGGLRTAVAEGRVKLLAGSATELEHLAAMFAPYGDAAAAAA